MSEEFKFDLTGPFEPEPSPEPITARSPAEKRLFRTPIPRSREYFPYGDSLLCVCGLDVPSEFGQARLHFQASANFGGHAHCPHKPSAAKCHLCVEAEEKERQESEQQAAAAKGFC